MYLKKKFAVLLGLSLCHSFLMPLTAKASKPAIYPLFTKVAAAGVCSIWSCSHQWPDKYAAISFFISPEGYIYDPTVSQSSGDIQYDAECLESICSQSPLESQVDSTNAGSTLHPTFKFGSQEGLVFNLKPAFDGSDVKEHLQALAPIGANPSSVIIHKIPLSMLIRHPNMFTKEELLQPKNLIEISSGTGQAYVNKIANFYAIWSALLKKTNVSKEEILSQAKQLPARLD